MNVIDAVVGIFRTTRDLKDGVSGTVSGVHYTKSDELKYDNDASNYKAPTEKKAA